MRRVCWAGVFWNQRILAIYLLYCTKENNNVAQNNIHWLDIKLYGVFR